jgi:hypothetical protein
MAGNNEQEVCCCFCGKWLNRDAAIILLVSSESMSGERQTLFSHKTCLVELMHISVPLHPELTEEE